MKLSNFISPGSCIAASAALTLLVAVAPARASDQLKTTITANDHAAAETATTVYLHAKPANTPAARQSNKSEVFSRRLRSNSAGSEVSAQSASAASGVSTSEVQVRYPGDLSYLGGAVVQSAESHPVFLNPKGKCPTLSCWGDPAGFLDDLSTSELIHVTDRYVGTSANNRYTVGQGVEVDYAPPKAPLTDQDMVAIAHAAASKTGGSGYGHIYHIFLPRGQDVCFDSTDTSCYSPDNPPSFVFCGYHSSVDFKDIGHVLYTVEPYGDVDGCKVKPGTPNGQLADSTNNILSHELIETITDPDGDAWYNFSSGPLFYEEIADECIFITVDFSVKVPVTYIDPATFKIGDKMYAVQPEYSNLHHSCTTAY